uniref:RICTOR_N domain-containing protein n=1 Tax=Angiostrongylus cantonensis TaxID=6313 RepID=A0A0K0DI73_ANGCA
LISNIFAIITVLLCLIGFLLYFPSDQYHFSVVELLRDDHPAIRAMCFRLLRLCLFTEKNLVFLLTNHADIYAVRALDLQVSNDMEREDALQLIVTMMGIYQRSHLKRLIEFSAAQREGNKKSILMHENELVFSTNTLIFRLSFACFEVFLEFCVLEPELILNMAGTDWMVRLCGVASVVAHILVSWLDRPHLREKGKLHLVLEQIFAPLIEFGFFQKNLSSTDINKAFMVQAAMHNFSHSFLCILRSWAGLFSCAAIGPNSTVIPSSPFRLLEYLGLSTVDDSNLSRIWDMIVDICCDFMDLPYASMVFESWPKPVIIVEWLEFQSLARLIVSQPDSASGLKATLFLSDILRMATSVMPSGWRSTMNSMPTLVQSACETLAQSKAAAAIHGYYDPTYADRFTFLNSENAAMVLHRFDTLNKIWIANECAEPAADSNYSLFLCPPKLFSSPLRAFCGEVIN